MQAYFVTFAGAVPVAAALAVKGALWLAAIFLLTSALRNASAATRHLVWAIGIAGLFALPFLSNNLPWRIAVPFAVAPDAHRAQPLDTPGDAPTLLHTDAEKTVGSLGIPGSVPISNTSTALPAATQSTAPMQAGTWLVIVWYAGAVVLLLRLGRSVASVRRILANASPADDPHLASTVGALARRLGIRRHIRLITADNITIPFTTGVLRPVIALPRGRLSWDQQKTEAVLLHELAHIARFDLWTSFAAHVACALYWFNPLIWVASRKMRIEGERACDDAVLRFGKRASDYADQLLEVVRDTRNRWAPTVAVAMARRSAFEGRLLAILSPEINRRRLTPRLATAVALGVALLTLPIAAMRPGKSAAPSDPAQSSVASDTLKGSAPVLEAQDIASRGAVARGLAAALKDDDEGVRLAAIQAIHSREERTLITELLPLLSDSSSTVRRAVAEALSGMPDPRAIDALLQALRSDADAGVRQLAAQALGQIDDERAVPGLSAALRQERVTAVRRSIVWALAEIESPSTASAFVDALRDDDAEVRQHAVWGLGSIQAKSAAPQIVPLLRDANADVRSKAAWALGEMKSIDALDELMAAVGDANADVRQHAIDALSSLETTRALPAFLRAMRDANVDVRRSALNAVSNLEGLEKAPRELIDALSDEDLEVRQSALQGLAHIKDPSTVSAIIPLTRTGQPIAVREAAVEALAEMGGPQVEAVLLELMKDPDAKIRRRAAQGLGRD